MVEHPITKLSEMCQEYGYRIVPGEHKKLARISTEKAIAKFKKDKLHKEEDSAIVAILGP